MRVGARAAGAVASLAALLALAACSGSSTLTRAAAPSATVSEHVTSSSSARRALLGAADVGLLKPVTYRRPTTPLFCRPRDAPTVFDETHAVDLVGARFGSSDPKADLVEEVYLYRTVADARAALETMQGDMDCATGHIYNGDGTTDVVAVGASYDYSTKLTAQLAYGWSLLTKTIGGIEIAVPEGTSVMLFRYTAAFSAKTTKLPDAFQLASTAASRLSRA